AAHRLVDGFVETHVVVVVGQVDFDGGVTGGHDADEVVVLHEVIPDVLEHFPGEDRVRPNNAHVVDEDDEHAAGRVGLHLLFRHDQTGRRTPRERCGRWPLNEATHAAR